uniref:Uncharacterized protein n=1 Tax=Rhizophora mucronata TaxID=61149 RepID=A0A2P2PCI5_RHIMU
MLKFFGFQSGDTGWLLSSC